MLCTVYVVLLLGPLIAQAGRKGSKCHSVSQSTVIITHYVTLDAPAETTIESIIEPTSNLTAESTVESQISELPYTSETINVALSSTSAATSSTIPSESAATSTSQESQQTEDSLGIATSYASDQLATSTESSPYADATQADVGIQPLEQCGTNDRLSMPGLPWSVANNMYNAYALVGTQCTNYNQVAQTSNGTYLVEWTSTTDVENIEDTEGLCKGYSAIDIGENLETRYEDIKSIPAYYKWSRSAVFDIMTSSIKNEGQTVNTHEFMLFLKTWGGQVPIGYADGPVQTLDMYGTTWKVYAGKNEAYDMSVWSMIPDTPFEGEFSGDLKVWLDAMIESGYASSSEFVNHGSCGVEIFYGNSQMEATVALDINL